MIDASSRHSELCIFVVKDESLAEASERFGQLRDYDEMLIVLFLPTMMRQPKSSCCKQHASLNFLHCLEFVTS